MADGRRRVRLWLIAAVLFAAGLAGRLTLEFSTDVAYSYPTAIGIQFLFYGAGLIVLAVSWSLGADSSRRLMGFVRDSLR